MFSAFFQPAKRNSWDNSGALHLSRNNGISEKKLCGGNSAVECQLPKLDVAGSIPVPRSIFNKLAGTPTSGLLLLLL